MSVLGHDLAAFAPELLLLSAIALVIVLDLVRGRGPSTALGLMALCVAAALRLARAGAPSAIFSGLLFDDAVLDLGLPLFCGIGAGALLLGGRGAEPRERGRDEAEWVALVLLATVGMSVLARAADLLTVYVGLETLSLMSYLMVALGRRRRAAAEAALKYVIYGGVASGAMLYGMSLLYGLAGSTRLVAIGPALLAAPTLGLLAVVLCFAGFGYKIAAAPFHAWAPDVYEGAPAPVAALLSIGAKSAGMIALLRFVALAAPSQLPAQIAAQLGGALSAWEPLWPLVAMATMTLGNLAALGQRNVQRLLAYSSIAQAGYLLTGLVAGPHGASATLLYLVAYAFMSLGAFAVVSALDGAGFGAELLDWRGLGRRAPVLGVAAACALFSLVGLPPFAGFVGKWALLSALLEPGSATRWGGALALLLVLNSVVSLAYYARVLRVLFLEAPAVDAPIPLATMGRGRALVLGLCTAGTVLFLVFAGPLGEIAERASLALAAPPRPLAAPLRLPVVHRR